MCKMYFILYGLIWLSGEAILARGQIWSIKRALTLGEAVTAIVDACSDDVCCCACDVCGANALYPTTRRKSNPTIESIFTVISFRDTIQGMQRLGPCIMGNNQLMSMNGSC